MCISGLCTETPAGGWMSPAVTSPGPCLRRYMLTGSACSEVTVGGFTFMNRRTRDGRQQGPPKRVAEGVAEARLQRLDGEPGTGLAERLLREARALADEH